MKLLREQTWLMFEAKWCPVCGEITRMEQVRTNFPGIQAQKCNVCNKHFQANYLEDGKDELEIPDSFKLMKFMKPVITE
jgi:hypothetical protein